MGELADTWSAAGRTSRRSTGRRPIVTDDAIKARRHAREIVGEMLWRGMTVPPLYAHMAQEFKDLVHSGDYAA